MNPNKKITVVQIVNDLNVGGVTSVVKELTKNKSIGFEITIVNLSGKADAETEDFFLSKGVKIYNQNYCFHEGYRLLEHIKNAYSLGARSRKNTETQLTLKQIAPDIIHLHVLPFELGELKRIINNPNANILFTDHSARAKLNEISKVSGFVLKHVFKKLYANLILIPVGPAVREFHEEFGIVKVTKKYKEIFNKIPARQERIVVEDKPITKFVYVARISPLKGHLDLIEAWAELPEMNLTLFIVGPDEMNGKMQKRANELNCLNKISFTGSISDVSNFLLDMDVGLFPSYNEGLPLALLEKMQVGIPCIVSDIDELTGVIDDELTGLIYPLGSKDWLKEKIIRLAKNVELRKTIGENAFKSINQNYVSKLGGIAKEYESFYLEIMKIP